MQKLIIDTDPGIDDFLAIAVAQEAKDIDLLALTTVFGNVDIEQTTKNACYIAELFNHSFKVIQGAHGPLDKTISGKRDSSQFHAKDGLGNITNHKTIDLRHVDLSLSAAHYIVDQANEYKGELNIVTLGALTNIALALDLDSDLPKKIKQVVCMGGAVLTQGNATPAAEFNFWSDPLAADKVISAGFNLHLVGLDVTQKVVLDDVFFNEMKTIKKPFINDLYKACQFYTQAYKEQVKIAGCRCHDPSAVMYFLKPDLFNCITGATRVLTEGIGAGQTIIDQSHKHSSQKHAWVDIEPVTAAVAVQEESVKQNILKILNN
ncbi:MAG TPA: nucleoside hydrolase [Oligoflexia bacterium]|nr:nucleoside hydrolase [Oligoflexia bacterium]HMR24031.1 nucleoside hydrolase [Oligoflexia bacterium]